MNCNQATHHHLNDFDRINHQAPYKLNFEYCLFWLHTHLFEVREFLSSRRARGPMIDAIEIIEVMTGGAVTIYTQVFSSDYKREDECMFTSTLHSETQ